MIPKKNLPLALLFFFITLKAFCQDQVLLDENFIDNKNNWKLKQNADLSVKIENGSLHLEKFETNWIKRGCQWLNQPVPSFNTVHNFSITYWVKFVSGGDISESVDFLWGEEKRDSNSGLSLSSLFQINLDLNGSARLNYFNKDWTYFVRKDVQGLLAQCNFKKDQVNKYELIQQDGFVSLKINDVEILRQMTTPTAGNSIGFQQCLKSAWQIDRILIRQDKVKTPIPADSSAVIGKANTAEVGQTPGKKKDLLVYPNPFLDRFQVNIELEQEETVVLTVADMRGAIIQHHTRKLQKGTQQVYLYIDGAPGTYFLKVLVGQKETITRQLIKQ